MAQIPFELVLDILDRSHFTKTDFPDYGTLRSLSLACKALERPSQKALFRNVYLARPKNASAFLRATEGGTEKGHWLASAVRFLNIRVEHTRNADKKHISILTFVTIFLRCTQLQEIKMRTEHYHPAFLSCWGTDNSLSEGAPNTLRTITAPDYRFALALLKACPQITSLSLGSARSPTPADVQLFQTRNLVEIQWFGSATVLAQLLQRNDNAPEYSSLEILGLRNIRHADSPSVTSVLQMVGKSLRSLRLQSIPSELCDTIRSHLLNLEEFILDQFPTEIILESLPRKTMKHLEILSHVHVDHKDARGIMDWIRSTPGLEAVTWNVSRGAGAVVDTEIQDAWGDIGALLRVCPEPFGYFQNETERLALERVSRFPRPLEFSPLRSGSARVRYFTATPRVKPEQNLAKPQRGKLRSPPIRREKVTRASAPVSGTFLPNNVETEFSFKMPVDIANTAPLLNPPPVEDHGVPTIFRFRGLSKTENDKLSESQR